MLKITQEQLDIMGETKLPAFFKTIAEYIQEEFPDFHAQHEVDITSWVATIYHKARTYKINTVKNHMKFVNYCCIFGDDFDEAYPFANAILTSNKSPNSKMAELKDAFVYELNKEEP